jgi:hypothetical protein
VTCWRRPRGQRDFCGLAVIAVCDIEGLIVARVIAKVRMLDFR